MRKLTNKCKSVSRVIISIALAVMLAACATAPKKEEVAKYDITVPATETSTTYLLMAEKAELSNRTDLHLLALKALISEGQYGQAEQIAEKLASSLLTPLQRSELLLNQAELAIAGDKLAVALNKLNFNPAWQLPSNQYLRFHLIKAKIYELLEQNTDVVVSLVEASSYMTIYEQQSVWERVWRLLAPMPPFESAKLAKSTNPVLAGWIEVLDLLRLNSGDPDKQQQALIDWGLQNPTHPAVSFLTNSPSLMADLEPYSPRHIALLLPLSDKYAQQGQALRDGFIQSMLDSEATPGVEPPKVSFYDTNALSMVDIHKALAKDNIDFVIGPLQKDKIAQYLDTATQRIPMLAMNVPPSSDKAKGGNICYFDLSHEQEAAQAARYIFSKKYQYPLVLAQDSSYGKRVSSAFAKQWASETGRPAQVEYFSDQATMQRRIQTIFGLFDSQNRIEQMRQILSLDLETEQRSRRDVDAVYLVASARQLMSLKPFIDIAINPDVMPPKLFASSKSNGTVSGIGQISENGEVKGVSFSDVPLIIDQNNPAAVRFHQLWPSQKNTSTRLYAIGMDAYQLIQALPRMQASSDFRLQGQSGELSMTDGCIVNRSLSWAKFGDQGIVAVE
ncbi:penicillin-binding protein activator [Veronia pacifica]|nr:penicillin-binding protein activator [Veronia pacifica]